MNGEPQLLASCYLRSLEVAAACGIATIAFPSISTGIYGYPVELAADVAVGAVSSYLAGDIHLKEVVFCCFSAHDLVVYHRLLNDRLV